MMKNEELNNELAYLKFEGKLVDDGYLDARQASEILLGFDESMRFFLHQVQPSLQDYQYEIPVGIRKGSWETFIPDIFNNPFVQAGIIYLASKYFGAGLEEIAKNDFQDFSLRKTFKKAVKGLQNVLRLAKHLKSIEQKEFKNVGFKDNNEFVGIENNDGEVLWIPIETLDYYRSFPKKSFKKIASLIEKERELILGVYEEDSKTEERIGISEKGYFVNDDEDDILFPELEHGMYVELEGHLTRGNENSNTVGFLYNNHVLTCYPEKGNIKTYKSELFTNCLMKGFVDRLDREGNYKEKRPRIKFYEIVSTEKGGEDNRDLFNSH